MLAIICGIIFIICGGYFVYDGLSFLWKEMRIRTRAEILDGTIVPPKSGTYNPRIRKYNPMLTFTWHEQTISCRSNRLAVLPKRPSGRMKEHVRVYYNPSFPKLCSHDSVWKDAVWKGASALLGGFMASTGVYLLL